VKTDLSATELAEAAVKIAERAALQWSSFGKFWRGAWRATAGWALVGTIIVNGMVLPLARLFGFKGEPLDWAALGAFLVAFVALVKYRHDDLKNGLTS
jgi:hypothetical protein